MSARNKGSPNLFRQVLCSIYSTIPYTDSLKTKSSDFGYPFYCVINQFWNVQLPTWSSQLWHHWQMAECRCVESPIFRLVKRCAFATPLAFALIMCTWSTPRMLVDHVHMLSNSKEPRLIWQCLTWPQPNVIFLLLDDTFCGIFKNRFFLARKHFSPISPYFFIDIFITRPAGPCMYLWRVVSGKSHELCLLQRISVTRHVHQFLLNSNNRSHLHPS